MSAIKQIEVNGTTYDINTFGSDLPIVCEVYSAGDSGETTIDRLNHGAPLGTTYTALSAEFVLKAVDDDNGNPFFSIVCAVASTSLS